MFPGLSVPRFWNWLQIWILDRMKITQHSGGNKGGFGKQYMDDGHMKGFHVALSCKHHRTGGDQTFHLSLLWYQNGKAFQLFFVADTLQANQAQKWPSCGGNSWILQKQTDEVNPAGLTPRISPRSLYSQYGSQLPRTPAGPRLLMFPVAVMSIITVPIDALSAQYLLLCHSLFSFWSFAVFFVLHCLNHHDCAAVYTRMDVLLQENEESLKSFYPNKNDWVIPP